ncbi:MAG: type II toxin-antitoxin system HicB family antitoxin [Candidatus Methylacidiphilales bacterium]|nr:type II toxin-antitoxin system HicB family antitoxin [Candidatus Methylacidiphilales bacterium]
MTLKAIVHKAEEGGFWAEVPALPGCVTQGETLEELRANLYEAIQLWLEAGESEEAGSRDGQILELAL